MKRRDRIAIAVANWWLRRVCSLEYLIYLDGVRRKGEGH